jgi:ribonuclease VapC
MSKVVLDASALIALIKGEKGAEEVEKLLGQIVMSTVNISEVAAILADLTMKQEDCQFAIEPFVESVIPFDTNQAYNAALLKNETKHKGLSFGDRACIALGIMMRIPIYTADKAWADLSILGAKIILIR